MSNPSVTLGRLLILIIGSIIASLITAEITTIINGRWRMKNERLTYLAIIAGFMEIGMYSFALLLKIQIFIAFWISVKTALKWQEKASYEGKVIWQTKEEIENDHNKLTYLRFLIGNSLNIIMSFIIASLASSEIITF